MRPALLLVVLALLAAPAAAEVSVDAAGPEAPVVPGEEVPLVLEVAVDCVTLWSREVVTVRFAAIVPDNATVEGPQGADYHKTDCPVPDGEAVKQHTFQARVRPGARAGVALPAYLSATVPGDALEPESFAVAQVDLVPAYVPDLRISVPSTIKQSEHGAATYALQLDNLGNDDVEVAFRLDKAPDRGGAVDLPDPVRVPAGGSVETSFTVRYDHDSWDTTTVRVVADAAQADTGDGGQTVATNVLLRNGALSARVRDAPGPAAVLPVALLGLAAVAARRR